MCVAAATEVNATSETRDGEHESVAARAEQPAHLPGAASLVAAADARARARARTAAPEDVVRRSCTERAYRAEVHSEGLVGTVTRSMAVRHRSPCIRATAASIPRGCRNGSSQGRQRGCEQGTGGWGERARATGWGSRWAGHGPAETMRLAAPDLLTAPWHRGGRRGRRRAVCDIVCVIVLRCGEDAAACNAVGQSTRARDSDEFRSSQRTTEGERTLGETPDMRGGRRGCRWMWRWRWGWLRGRG